MGGGGGGGGGGAALCICKQRVSGWKHFKICRKNLRVYAGRVSVTYVSKVGKNGKHYNRNLRV